MFDSQSTTADEREGARVCRNCGALIGTGEIICAHCGAALTSGTMGNEAGAAVVHDGETVRFARAILQRPAAFTFIFLISNVLMFLLTLIAAGGTNNEVAFNDALIALGAKTNALINAGEWWRFVTPIFLHGGWAHLLMNMYGLWILGPIVERLYGSAKFVFFWVGTGVVGVIASYLTVIQPGHELDNAIGRFLFKTQDVASVGASGALFGLIGVLFVFGIKFRHELPEGFKRAFGTGMLPTILLNVFIGYAFPFIDNAAHMGGLVSGAALALFVGYKRPGEKGRVAIFWHALQVCALALVLGSFARVIGHFKEIKARLRDATLSRELPLNISGVTQEFLINLSVINDSQKIFFAALNGDARMVDRAVQALDSAPPLDADATAVRNDLKSLLIRAKDFATVKAPERRADPRTRAQEQAQIIEGYKAWQEKFKQWLVTDGEKYGFKVQEQQTPAAQPPPNAPQQK